jgi:hypothetical protein
MDSVVDLEELLFTGFVGQRHEDRGERESDEKKDELTFHAHMVPGKELTEIRCLVSNGHPVAHAGARRPWFWGLQPVVAERDNTDRTGRVHRSALWHAR